jgi:hypothetical protein
MAAKSMTSEIGKVLMHWAQRPRSRLPMRRTGRILPEANGSQRSLLPRLLVAKGKILNHRSPYIQDVLIRAYGEWWMG